jgi:ADP-ribose pyrophosphatase
MIQPWKKIKEEIRQSGYRRIIRRNFELPDGKTADYDIIEEGKTVCVLALTNENKVVLCRQFRPGPEKVLLELPAGELKEGVDSIEQIKKELLEETGYTGDFVFVGSNIDAAYSTKIRYNFVAINCKRVQEPTLEDDEFIDVVELSIDDFKKHLESGELTDVETGYIGLKHLNLI